MFFSVWPNNFLLQQRVFFTHKFDKHMTERMIKSMVKFVNKDWGYRMSFAPTVQVLKFICQPCYFFMVPLKNRGRWELWSDNLKWENAVHTYTRWAHFDFENSMRAVNRIWPSSFLTSTTQQLFWTLFFFFIFNLLSFNSNYAFAFDDCVVLFNRFLV